MSSHPWLERSRSILATPTALILAGLALTAMIAAGVSWRLDRAAMDAKAGAESLVASWSSQLEAQLEAERTAWAPILTVLVRERLDPERATTHLMAAHRANGGPLQSKLFLLEEDGTVVASSVPYSTGSTLLLPRNGLVSTPTLLSIEPLSLSQASSDRYLAIAQALPAKVGNATIAVHFVPLTKLNAIAASAFEGKHARFLLADPRTRQSLVVDSQSVVLRAAPLLRPTVLNGTTAGPAATPGLGPETYEEAPFLDATNDGPWLSRSKQLPALGATLVVEFAESQVYHYVESSARPSTIALAAVMSVLVWAVLLVAAKGAYQSQRAQQHLEALVGIDPLTQLPNRRSFGQYLRDAMGMASRSQGLGLMFVDLDNFKYVNDTFGHDAGDDLLCEVARRLGASVRKEDQVFRLGGDEFTVALPGVLNRKEVEQVAERVLRALSNPVVLDGSAVYVSASVGVAVAPEDAESSGQLLRCADLAVYAAKERGKACYAAYDFSLKAKAEARATLTAEVRAGLSSGQFSLHYQPKVDMQSGVIAGYEALLRWNHPTRGFVSPSEFIPIAEESTLIHDIGNFVVEEAIQQVANWRCEGKGLVAVAINVSTAQLRDERAVNLIETLLQKYDVPGHYVQVEVTETMLAADMELAVRLIARLKQLGVRVAVDDFGTGYSSLAALQKFNVDYLKIDKSFVQGIEECKESLEICKAVIDLAHALNVRVIAEGVESFGQYVMLLEMGCDEAQGFLFSKARPAEDAIDWKSNVVLFGPTVTDRLAA